MNIWCPHPNYNPKSSLYRALFTYACIIDASEMVLTTGCSPQTSASDSSRPFLLYQSVKFIAVIYKAILGNIVETGYAVTLQRYNNPNLTIRYDHFSFIDYS